MTRARKNLGDSGERVAALFLEQRGYKIIERSWRTRTGEIDLVAEDADGLAFVEVRARRAGAGAPEESLTPRKVELGLYLAAPIAAMVPAMLIFLVIAGGSFAAGRTARCSGWRSS